jgi:translation initiation factor IF-3
MSKQKQVIKYDYDVPNVEVIVKGEHQEFIGKMPRDEAIQLAHKQGLHLILLSDKPVRNTASADEENKKSTDSVVCRICDIGRFKFEQTKGKVHVSKSATAVKHLQVKFGIHQHDIDMRIEQIKKFIESKHQVQLNVAIRNRDAKDVKNIVQMNKIVDAIEQRLIDHCNVVKKQPIAELALKGFIMFAPKK